jgi:hypothetical protein
MPVKTNWNGMFSNFFGKCKSVLDFLKSVWMVKQSLVLSFLSYRHFCRGGQNRYQQTDIVYLSLAPAFCHFFPIRNCHSWCFGCMYFLQLQWKPLNLIKSFHILYHRQTAKYIQTWNNNHFPIRNVQITTYSHNFGDDRCTQVFP